MAEAVSDVNEAGEWYSLLICLICFWVVWGGLGDMSGSFVSGFCEVF